MKKNLRIVAAILLVLVLCFTVSACGFKDGKSAYEIACENGFEGTVQEWLDSLKGDSSESLTQVINKNLSCVVSIFTTFQISSFPGSFMSAGSGVIYKTTDDGTVYIITNYHVVHDTESLTAGGLPSKIQLFMYGMEWDQYSVDAQFVGGSISKDIAVLSANQSDFPAPIKVATVADSNDITLGENVFALGNPLGIGLSATVGVISMDSETITIDAIDNPNATVEMRVIRTDTAVNGGNSGGGLFNSRGQLIGIVNAKSIRVNVDNIGYAIPTNIATGIADSIISGFFNKCLMGVTVTLTESMTQYNTQKQRVEIIDTIIVTDIISGSLTDGALQVDDKLVSIRLNNGTPLMITRLFHISDFLYKARVGDTIYCEVIRNGSLTTVSMVVTANNLTTL